MSDPGGPESGEVEEGELPDAPNPQVHHEQESGEASGYDDGEIPNEVDDKWAPPGGQGPGAGGPVDQPPGSERRESFPPRDMSAGPRVVTSPRGQHPAARGGTPRDPKLVEQQAADAKEERDREELHSLLRELTRYVSVQDAMRSLDTVCMDLKKAIKKLEKLFRKVKKKKGDDIEEYPDCFQYSKKIHEGLRSVHVVVGTSIGHTHSMETVIHLFRTAMNYRHDVFSGPLKSELEGWVRASRVLKIIILEKEREKTRAGSKPAGGSTSEAPGTGQAGGSVSGAAGSGGEGGMAVDGQEAQGGPQAGSADGEPAPPPPALPPPPSDPYPEPPLSPMSEDMPGSEAGPGAVGQQPGTPAVIPSGSGAMAMRGRAGGAGSSAFKFKIVVESTPADIRKAAIEEAVAAAQAAAAAAAQAQQQHALQSAHTTAASGGSGAAAPGLQGHPEAAAAGAGPGPGLSSLGKRGVSPDPSSRSGKKARGGAGAGEEHSSGRYRDGGGRGDRDRSRRSRSRSRSRERGDRDRSRDRDRGRGGSRDTSPGERGRYHPPGSPMSDEEGGIPNGHGPWPPGGPPFGGPHPPLMGPPFGRERDGPPFMGGRDRDRDIPPPGGWTFEERERHRMERERMERERMDIVRERESSADEVGGLLRRGRLVLVLDLDHTLLASTRFSELAPGQEALLGQRLEAEAGSLPDARRELYRSERLGVWTKLRPGAREFLARAEEMFEVWVRSAGSRPYAEAMASLLDPEDRVFGGRIIAAGGGVDGPDGPTAMHNKRLMAALEARSPIALALDDASAVWPMEARLGCLVVERYRFFPTSRTRYGLQGRSLLELNRDECPDYGMLPTLFGLLERLHGLVLAYLRHPGPPGALLSAPPAEPRQPPWDVRNVVADERRKVLQGVSICFSRVIPVEMDPRVHPLWRMAEAFGATCEPVCSDRTTHVVAAARGTEKTLWAAQHGRPVVTPAWLECCCTLWRKANEERFATPHA